MKPELDSGEEAEAQSARDSRLDSVADSGVNHLLEPAKYSVDYAETCCKQMEMEPSVTEHLRFVVDLSEPLGHLNQCA